jgi:hypothetical protein
MPRKTAKAKPTGSPRAASKPFAKNTASGARKTTKPTSRTGSTQAKTRTDRSKLPIPDSPFKGKIGTTYKQSESAWPDLPQASAGAPNVVIILLDDVGFGQVGTFGGPVPTPDLDALHSAAEEKDANAKVAMARQ